MKGAFSVGGGEGGGYVGMVLSTVLDRVGRPVTTPPPVDERFGRFWEEVELVDLDVFDVVVEVVF
jgi:hypothetical protein